MIDLIVFVFILYFIYRGYENGFVSGILNLTNTVLSFVLALMFYPQAAEIINNSFKLGNNMSNLIGFFGLLAMLECLGSVLGSLVFKTILIGLRRLPILLKLDRLLGIIPSFIVGSLFLITFLVLPVTLPFDVGLKDPIERSWVGNNVLPHTYSLDSYLQKLLKRLPTQNLFFTITPEPVSKEVTKLNFPPQLSLKESPADEKKLFELLNQERVKVGLKALRWDPEIVPVARAHSKDMFVRGYFSHYNPEGESVVERLDKAGIKFLAAGENLAYAPNVELAHQGLMNSPGHRANILRKEFGRVGIGVIDGGLVGKMFTQNFAD